MKEIEVGEYVRTVDGKIAIFDRYSSRKETSIYKSPFNCFIKLSNRKTPLQCHRDFIVKHSKNIIDLLKVEDFANGYKIIKINYKDKRIVIQNINEFGENGKKVLLENEIETILTKEQYMQNCYTVERGKMEIKELEKYLKERIESVDKSYNEMLTDIGGIKIINVSGLNRKEKEEVINKRNCLLVQKQCYQEILEKIQEQSSTIN